MGKIEHIAKKMGLKKSDVTRMALKKFIEEYSETV
jgi:antitoxin component of RelBE/YafQ-DinJ toxin-antitoxin module